MRNFILTQKGHCLDRDCNAALHVEYSRAPGAAVRNSKRHLVERSDVPDCVDVAEQKQRLALRNAGEIRLHMIAELFRQMNLRVSAVMLEPRSEKLGEMVDSRLVAAGRLDFN